MRRGWLLFLILWSCLVAPVVGAQQDGPSSSGSTGGLLVDLSHPEVSITSGFTGARVTLFGGIGSRARDTGPAPTPPQPLMPPLFGPPSPLPSVLPPASAGPSGSLSQPSPSQPSPSQPRAGQPREAQPGPRGIVPSPQVQATPPWRDALSPTLPLPAPLPPVGTQDTLPPQVLERLPPPEAPATDEIVVIVRGPAFDITVRRREQVAGVWVAGESVIFGDIPSFYQAFSSAAALSLPDGPYRAEYQVGLDRLKLQPDRPLAPDDYAEFRDALFRGKVAERLYDDQLHQVTWLNDQLFRAELRFPDNVPTGTYAIEVYHVRGPNLIGRQVLYLLVSKAGVSADISELARDAPMIYGLVAVVAALLSGWLASVAFRRR